MNDSQRPLSFWVLATWKEKEDNREPDTLSGLGGHHAEPQAGTKVGYGSVWTRCWKGERRSSEETHLVSPNTNLGQDEQQRPRAGGKIKSTKKYWHTCQGKTREGVAGEEAHSRGPGVVDPRCPSLLSVLTTACRERPPPSLPRSHSSREWTASRRD